jgi:2-oxoacid:acceptor oxidoreductase delta subunit (pyruvate/2-ketoisovalerate family)
MSLCEVHKAKPPKSKRVKRKTDFPEPGLTQEEAVTAARQCLGMMDCSACDVCQLLCPELCITRDQATGQVQIDLDYCKGCGICASVCPKGAIRMVLDKNK